MNINIFLNIRKDGKDEIILNSNNNNYDNDIKLILKLFFVVRLKKNKEKMENVR